MPYDGDVRDHEPLVLRVLRRSRSTVQRGWCQRGTGLRDALGVAICTPLPAGFESARYLCLSQAINEAVHHHGGVNVNGATTGEVYQRLNGGWPVSWHAFPRWNDEDGRTQDDVLGLFDEAIRFYEEELSAVR